MSRKSSVWTADANLAEVLADAVLNGFPLTETQAKTFTLSQWTVLVPTRRAARKLDDLLFERAGKKGLVLPRIRPIGDVDEDDLFDAMPELDVPAAMATSTRLFHLLTLIDQWADENPQLPLALNVKQSPAQCLGLAESLGELIDQIETEEISLRLDQLIFDLDLAVHRQSILSLLALVLENLPQIILKANAMGRAARRNALLRLEAERIRQGFVKGPIIAAGSTGTNPATRDLLAAIASHPFGAVILPGLDLSLQPQDRIVMTASHPQYAMKILLEELSVELSDVEYLGAASPRAGLMSQLMRPAETTAQWHNSKDLAAIDLDNAMAGIGIIAAPDRHLEARAIALAMREVLETQDKTAALVTPDRDLAQRVTAELLRWNVMIDDSAGQALLLHGRGHVLDLVLRTVEDDFAVQRLVALLSHPDCTLGLTPVAAKHMARLFELVGLRRDLPLSRPQSFAEDLLALKPIIQRDRYAHPRIAELTEEQWTELLAFAATLSSALKPIMNHGPASFANHVENFSACLELLSPIVGQATSIDVVLSELLSQLRQDPGLHPMSTQARAISTLRWCLKHQQVRPVTRKERLSIYGLPEARMMTADVVILGGLNENIWPAAADPGPWVNRSMRQHIGLQQPERDIGITAHDFAQNMQHGHVLLSYAQRKGSEPLMKSRWLLRLNAVLQTRQKSLDDYELPKLVELAVKLDQPSVFVPAGVPKPCPPIAARPRQISISDVQTLKRDPYGFYAAKILRLQPLNKLGAVVEPRLRGQLFHDALAAWGKTIILDPTAPSLDILLREGERVFAPYIDTLEVKHFWWPRFVRMATAMVREEHALSQNVVARLTEQRGTVEFMAAGVSHTLTARADRIDVLSGQSTRIIDYKTGVVPSRPQVNAGFYPQLTLTAAIAMNQGFGRDVPITIDDVIYIKTSGGAKPVEVTALNNSKFNATLAAQRHFAGLKTLMAEYQNPHACYLPRVAVFKEDDELDYDHLSRFAEWSLGGA